MESPQSPSATPTDTAETAPETTAENAKETATKPNSETPPTETPSETEIAVVAVEEAPVTTESVDTAKSPVKSDPIQLVSTESESKPDSEVADAMQVEEIRTNSTPVETDSSKKLDDILSWLHNEPPLTEEQLSRLCIEQRDFDIALKNVQPSAKREGFATVPDVTWDDIGSLQDIRQELQMTIMVMTEEFNVQNK